jgi:hypothetical protein
MSTGSINDPRINSVLADAADRYGFSWSTLAEISRSFFVRSSYFWFVTIPIVVKLLSQLESPAFINLFGHTFKIVLALPFSWWLFYFSSVALAIGRVVFVWRCPVLVRKYLRFDDFQIDGQSQLLIKSSYADSAKRRNYQELIANFWSRFAKGAPTVNLKEFPWNPDIDRNRLSDAFYFVRSELSLDRPYSRLFCTTAFFVGGLLFTATCVSAFWFVIHYVFLDASGN